MSELTRIRLRTLLWLPLPVCVLVILPWLIERSATSTGRPWGAWQWIGVWLIANGLGLVAWCVHLFNRDGHGTPLPLDPPKRFVISGPYRYVRNPMILGVLLVLTGEAALAQSWRLALYAVCIFCLAHGVVRYWEEPDLIRRFGQPYVQYKRQVPRWVPRAVISNRRQAPSNKEA